VEQTSVTMIGKTFPIIIPLLEQGAA
jgi:hypothetical protein